VVVKSDVGAVHTSAIELYFCPTIANILRFTGGVSIYLCGGGNVNLVSSVIGQVGTLAFNPAIGGYTWTNNSGITATFGFFFVRTRQAA
jgi:hypothetical protein